MTRVIILLYRTMGVALAIAIMEALAAIANEPIARVPFVTSIVLVLALPDSAAAQPRALIGGHLIASLAGWLSLLAFGPGETASAIGVAGAALGMIATGTMHPPAGIDAFLVVTQGLPAHWMVSPVLIGAVLLAGFSRLWTEGERRAILKVTIGSRTR